MDDVLNVPAWSVEEDVLPTAAPAPVNPNPAPLNQPLLPTAPTQPGERKRETAVKWIKALCLVGAVGSTTIGCYGFWFSWHTYHKEHQIDPVFTLVSFYVAIFGLALTLAELDTAIVFKRMPFLASRFGRSMTYIFIGSLAFVLGVQFARKYDSWYVCVAGGYQMAAGSLLALSYCCVKSGEAGEYNAYRQPGRPTYDRPTQA